MRQVADLDDLALVAIPYGIGRIINVKFSTRWLNLPQSISFSFLGCLAALGGALSPVPASGADAPVGGKAALATLASARLTTVVLVDEDSAGKVLALVGCGGVSASSTMVFTPHGLQHRVDLAAHGLQPLTRVQVVEIGVFGLPGGARKTG